MNRRIEIRIYTVSMDSFTEKFSINFIQKKTKKLDKYKIQNLKMYFVILFN